MEKPRLFLFFLALSFCLSPDCFCQSVPVEKLIPILNDYKTITTELSNQIEILRNETASLKELSQKQENELMILKNDNQILQNQLLQSGQELIAQQNLLMSSNETISDLKRSSKKQNIKSVFIGIGIGFLVGAGSSVAVYFLAK